MKKVFLFLIVISVFSCQPNSDDTGEMPLDNFDRTAMLSNWANDIIVPSYEAFATKSEALKTAGTTFANAPNADNLSSLKTNWQEAYLLWQRVSMFEIGKAEELRFRNNMNIYPVDVVGLDENVLQGGYNLELNSEIDKQGFPALDYLLFGIKESEEAVLDFYNNDENAAKYLVYLLELVTRIDDLTDIVLADWKGTFKDEFINNDGNSATASVDKLINDFLFYYEANLRAGKVGIPAGVFSGTPLRDKVEAFYKKDISKMLLLEALDATQDFFNGQHFGNTNTKSESLSAYLDALNTVKDGADLSALINNQFDAARDEINKLNDNFATQVEADNSKMLATYDQLQLNVVLLKVDMLQALNINVDYVDADGD